MHVRENPSNTQNETNQPALDGGFSVRSRRIAVSAAKRRSATEQGPKHMLKTGHATALALLCAMACAHVKPASAGVVVTIDGNTAHAQISLDNGVGTTYDAEATITFSSVSNLSADSLNLTAELVDPDDQALQARLPTCLLAPCVAVDPAFPMLITVEPPTFARIFRSSFEDNETGDGNLSFKDTYEFEVHTHDLVFANDSPYRLIKAPIDDKFHDYTADVLPGSVRVRGRDGAFSQFLVVRDSYTHLVPMLLYIAGPKLVDLELRVLAAALDDALNLELVGLLADITADLAILGLDLTGAIAALDQLIAEVTAHAGDDIPNVWNSSHDVSNDAGEILGLAQTLRFTLVRLQTAPL
jgi:hypothetical protein